VGKRASARFSASVQDKSNEITAIPALLSCLTWQVVLSHRCDGDSKVLLIRFIPQVQIIFSVLNQIIPRCFNRWNSGFSKCRRMAPYPPHVNTPLSLDITASTHAPFGHSRWTAALYQADAWAGLQYCHRGTDSSVMEQNHPRSAVLSAVPPHSPKLPLFASIGGKRTALILDVTFGEDACRVRSPCTPQSGTVTSLCRQCAQSSRLKQTKPQAEV